MRMPPLSPILFATFVLNTIVAGGGLAVLEGHTSEHPILGSFITVSFFLTLPLLVAAAIFAWREEARKTAQDLSLSPKTRLLTLGIFAALGCCGILIMSVAPSSLGPFGDVLITSAIPCLVAAAVWSIVLRSARKRALRSRNST